MIHLSPVFGLIVGLAHFEGGLISLFSQDTLRQNLVRIVQPFSSGALLSLALIHLVPMSMRLFSWSPVVFLGSIAGLMVLTEFGKPDRVFALTPRWGQRCLLSIYAASFGILIGMVMANGFRVALIATIVGIPTQFVQGIKGFANRSSQFSRKEFLERLFLTSLPVPLIALILQRVSHELTATHTGFLLSLSTAVILHQAILEFRIPYPMKFSPKKIFYFLSGVFIVYCL